MLRDAEKDAIQRHYHKLRRNFKNFKNRRAQRQMIGQIAQTFAQAPLPAEENSIKDNQEKIKNTGTNILVIEAPTGVGKSLAYLLAGTLMAQFREKTLVIASATIALQEQLVNKDLPEFLRNSEIDATYALAKGRGHYLCPYRLEQYSLRSGQTSLTGLDGFIEEGSQIEEREIKLFKDIAARFHDREFSGDREEWPEKISDTTWNKINNNRHICLKKDCPRFSVCPFFVTKEKLNHVDIVVANYDLLLSDLALGGGVILPLPQYCFYCFDEAHHLAKKARDHFAESVSLHELKDLNRYLPSLMKKIANSEPLNKWVHELEAAARGLGSLINDWENYLEEEGLKKNYFTFNEDGSRGTWLFDDESFSLNFRELLTNMTTKMAMIEKALVKVQESLFKVKKDSLNFAYGRLQNDLARLTAVATRAGSVWRSFARAQSKTGLPWAKWITRVKEGPFDFEFHASPILATQELNQLLWDSCAAALLTSATLKSGGDFTVFLQKTGLSRYPEVRTLSLDTPFELSEQVELFIPPLRHNPQESHLHTREIAEWLPKLINLATPAGTLCLFSSKKQMQEVFLLLPEDFREHILVQGVIPKPELLKRHMEAIKNLARASIIFGLDSFAEGLDLKGELCNQVIIAKIPFAMPDNPIDSVYRAWLKKEGRNAFFEVAVPDAELKLAQAMGRLIRSEQDRGRITILDNRLLSKGYGKMILAGFPPYKRIASV